ncbi:topology modulation protein [Neobacillus sp. OS1-32]|uniref:topology modulation protein n=1 Tax=Neobacillus sp. OS1-32 TaxID=3070682 RepID=UPI0027E06C13|nr:topology modulation protein [Neobacillus sp. OS1-32]WML31444.1 topology modulation protein [Neobacillus sp. OS1-32]
MDRIMVIGISPGTGKSTFARKLGQYLHINVYHLDVFYWKPNWIEASLEEFSNTQQNLVNQCQWIIEGNYSSTFEIRAERADTIIYLELPLRVCLYRVVKRWLLNIGRTRTDMADGCKEKLDWDFIKFICTTYYPRKRIMNERLQSLESKKEIVTLKSKQEIRNYLENIKMKKNDIE